MYDVVVVGGGPGGYVAAIRSAQLGLKVACVDKNDLLGGTCLRVGCIPSKTLLHTTEVFEGASHLDSITGEMNIDFAKMMANKTEVLTTLGKGIEMLFGKHKIEWIKGTATFDGTLKVDGKPIETKHVILATGSEPIPLPFLPFDEKKICSSTGALSLESPPKRLLLVGAGVVGLELGSVYRRLGTEVTVIEFLDHICPSLDGTFSKAFQKILEKQGMTFHLSSKVIAGDDSVKLEVEGKGTFEGDVALISIGRRPYTSDITNIDKDQKGFITVNKNFQTSNPNVYAIGDIIDGPMLAHKASEEGVAVAEIIAGHNPRINYLAIPTVVYTTPEIAAVGFTEEQAQSMGLSYKTGSFSFKANSRGRVTGDIDGMVKIITDAATDKIIGMHIMCSRAGDMIQEGVCAIEKGITARELGAMSHSHPTFTEAVKEAALAVHKEQIHS